jgi:hypothetical protein
MAWTGTDNHLNVAKITMDSAQGVRTTQIVAKQTLVELSDTAPALCQIGGRLCLAWKGFRNNDLNISFSHDVANGFLEKRLIGEASRHAPAIAEVPGDPGHQRLLVAWTGMDRKLNVRA